MSTQQTQGNDQATEVVLCDERKVQELLIWIHLNMKYRKKVTASYSPMHLRAMAHFNAVGQSLLLKTHALNRVLSWLKKYGILAISNVSLRSSAEVLIAKRLLQIIHNHAAGDALLRVATFVRSVARTDAISALLDTF
jgi:hypothetical protein